MARHSDLAAKLLRNAANFYRHVAENNPGAAEALRQSADTCDSVAVLVEQDPTGSLPLDSSGADDANG